LVLRVLHICNAIWCLLETFFAQKMLVLGKYAGVFIKSIRHRCLVEYQSTKRWGTGNYTHNKASPWGCHREKLTSCYNHVMTLKDELRAYRTRWVKVDAMVAEERRTASIELRWQQLNAAYAMAIGLGLRQEDTSEAGVFERWVKLKEKAVGLLPKA
jgi:hypothetical protein